MSARLRDGLSMPDGGPIPEGPYFVYDRGPQLFLGRCGRGPLHVAWDTNLLIDYFEHGRALWEGDCLPELAAAEVGEELEALQLIISLWVFRDIRFHILRRVLRDAKGELAAERVEDRRRAFEEFEAALSLGEPDEEAPSRDGLLILRDAEVQRALERLPAGTDRELVHDAIQVGVHVFLTRDKGVLKCRDPVRSCGLLIATPLDLLEELASCGAIHCLMAPKFAYWPVPDLQRVSHLIQALPPRSMADGE